MTMHIDDAQTDTHIDDEDLTTADRGDDLRDDSATDDGDDESAPGKEYGRDEKGRFAKKNGGDEEAESDAATDEDEDGEAADDETDDEGDGASAAKKDPKNFAIRFNKAKQQRDAAIERARELENELAKLRGGKSEADAASPTDKLNSELDALYEKVEDARADGDTKAAAALQRQIDGKNREIARIEAAELAAKTTQASTVSARFDALLDVAETLVPELSVGADTYDEEAVREIQFQVEAYSRMGMPADKALVKAVKVLHGVDLGAKRASKTGIRCGNHQGAEEKGGCRQGTRHPAPAAAGRERTRRQPRQLAHPLLGIVGGRLRQAARVGEVPRAW